MKKNLLVLAALELALFGATLPRLGFYHDDWINLEWCAIHPGWSSAVGFYLTHVLARPLQAFFFPTLCAVGGQNPLVFHLACFALEVLEILLIFVLLRRLIGEKTALAAAAIAAAFPNHAATHFWTSAAAQLVSIDLALASLLFHLDWIAGGGALTLGASLAAYLANLLFYESAAFLPLIALAGVALRRQAEGQAPRAAWLRAARGFLPYAGAIAAALLWQRLALVLLHRPNARPIAFSPWRGSYALFAGLECISNRTAMICLDALARLRGVSGILRLGAAAAIGASAAAFLPLSETAAPEERRRLGALAIAAWLAAYLPYALSHDYIPSAAGIMSRTSACGAIAGAFLVVWILSCLRLSPAVQRGVVAGVIAAFALANWDLADQWRRSWAIQQDILARLAPRAASLPRSATVLLKASRYIDDDPARAVIFDAHYDIGAALRLRSGREDLSADVVSPRLIVGKNPGRVQDVPVYAYENLFLYDYAADTLRPLMARR